MLQFKNFLLVFISILFISCQPEIKEIPPNIIYIFPDEYRNYSLGFWSQDKNAEHLQGNPDPVSTPALDKLASEGIVFSRATSNYPLCSPYRGMLLTGMYPDHNGLTTNCRQGRDVQLKTDAVCITDVFAKNGYNVSYFGKCHWQKTEPLFDDKGNYFGSTEAPGGNYINRYDTYVPPGPDRHSIDYFFQALSDVHFNPKVYSNDPKEIEGKKDGELYMPGRFSSELESEKIIAYLKNTHNQRDVKKPFFMIWSLNPPHPPWTEESTQMDFFPQYAKDGKVNLRKLLTRGNVDSTVAKYAPYYFANVSAVDYYIGKVLKQLDKMNLTDNTIIVFSSDHGEMLGSHGLKGKNVAEIESLNIPFIIKWTKKLNHRIENLILSVPDIMPTLLSLAGLKDQIPKEVQGKDYSSILTQNKTNTVEKPASALFINLRSRGIYTGKLTFVVTEEKGEFVEAYCYDNISDPYQLNKIPYNEVYKGNELRAQLAALLKQTNDRWYQEKICSGFLPY